MSTWIFTSLEAVLGSSIRRNLAPDQGSSPSDPKKESKSSLPAVKKTVGEFVFAPQFDWDQPFETVVSLSPVGKPFEFIRSVLPGKKAEEGRPRELVFAPQFDWVNPFDTIISRPK